MKAGQIQLQWNEAWQTYDSGHGFCVCARTNIRKQQESGNERNRKGINSKTTRSGTATPSTFRTLYQARYITYISNRKREVIVLFEVVLDAMIFMTET